MKPETFNHTFGSSMCNQDLTSHPHSSHLSPLNLQKEEENLGLDSGEAGRGGFLEGGGSCLVVAAVPAPAHCTAIPPHHIINFPLPTKD